MDDKLRQLGAALVAVAAVPHEQLGEVEKLLDREVGREAGLPALLAHDAHADVGGLDHRDVVAAVADAAHALLGVLLDELGHLGLLRRGAPARHHRGQEDGDRDEVGAEVRQVHAQALAVDEQAGIGLAAEEVEVLLGRIFPPELGNGVDVLASGNQLGADGHTARRLDLVARQHPDLDAGVA